MQVDTVVLRKASKRLRDEVAASLRQAGDAMRRNADDNAVDFAFDVYTGSAPYRAAAQGWQCEVGVLKEAVEQLAEAMERAADEYDAADARAKDRMSHGAR